jgi:hypothetical protein
MNSDPGWSSGSDHAVVAGFIEHRCQAGDHIPHGGAAAMAAATGTLPAGFRSLLNTDSWFYGVFQSAPDLIRWLVGTPAAAVPLELDR